MIKQKNIRKINRLIALVCCITGIGFLLSACARLDYIFFGKPKGSYHHAVAVASPMKTIFVGDNIYCIMSNGIFNNRLYRITYDGFAEISLPNNHAPTDIQTDGSYLYVAASVYGMYIYDASGNFVEHIMQNSRVNAFLLCGQKIYYTGPLYTSEEPPVQYLFFYDRATQAEQAIEEAETDCVIEIEGQNVFVDGSYKLYWETEIGAQNQRMPNNYGWSSEIYYPIELAFIEKGAVGKLFFDDENVTLTYKGARYDYSLGKAVYRFYPQIRVINGIVYFAVGEYIEPNDCECPYCICRFNGSKQLCFDLEKKQFSLRSQIGERAIYVTFNATFCSYYAYGKVYRNEKEALQTENIEPFGSYITRNPYFKEESMGGVAQIYDDGNNIRYKYIDCSAWLKDEY